MSRKPKNHTGLKIVLILLIFAMIAVTGYVIKLCIDITFVDTTVRPGETVALTPDTVQTEPAETKSPPETTLPEPERVVSTATIGSMGDLLMHIQLFSDLPKYNSVNNLGNGNYNFDSIFEYLVDYTSACDYMVANLETTFGGEDFPYQGNPSFNCPDALMDALVAAGYDMLLTANNHCGDTLMTGIDRTLEVVRDKGVAALGTQLPEEPNYSVVDINGIRIGMVCYTYALKTVEGKPDLNYNTPVANPEQVNWFTYNNLDKLYSEMEAILADMEAEGAEATMLYIHWGDEYFLEENHRQNTIAQKMCDLGVDVIVGGHPHVVQPMELLSSTTDPEHKTVCLYSMGNAVSNQRFGNISRITTPHTEDGLLFRVTFEKYSDGSVYLAGTDILPTWVNMHYATGKREYNILPLDYERVEEWEALFEIDGNTLTAAKNSYGRTMDIVDEGLAACRTWLAQAKEARETYYVNLAVSGSTP